VKQLLEDNSAEVYDLFFMNVKAAKVKNPELLTKHILTYASGMSLRAIVLKSEELQEELVAFLDFCKK
jgi:hypothetical protein